MTISIEYKFNPSDIYKIKNWKNLMFIDLKIIKKNILKFVNKNFTCYFKNISSTDINIEDNSNYYLIKVSDKNNPEENCNIIMQKNGDILFVYKNKKVNRKKILNQSELSSLPINFDNKYYIHHIGNNIVHLNKEEYKFTTIQHVDFFNSQKITLPLYYNNNFKSNNFYKKNDKYILLPHYNKENFIAIVLLREDYGENISFAYFDYKNNILYYGQSQKYNHPNILSIKKIEEKLDIYYNYDNETIEYLYKKNNSPYSMIEKTSEWELMKVEKEFQILHELIHFHLHYKYDVKEEENENETKEDKDVEKIENETNNLYLEFQNLINLQEKYFIEKDYPSCIEITLKLVNFPYSEVQNEKTKFGKYKRLFYYNLIECYSLLKDETKALEFMEKFINSLNPDENNHESIKITFENNQNLNNIKHNLKYELLISSLQ